MELVIKDADHPRKSDRPTLTEAPSDMCEYTVRSAQAFPEDRPITRPSDCQSVRENLYRRASYCMALDGHARALLNANEEEFMAAIG